MYPFNLNDKQLTKLATWRADHFRECKYYIKHEDGFEEIYTGAIGGELTYSFTPTGVGVVAKVQCACGKEVDLTDYENW